MKVLHAINSPALYGATKVTLSLGNERQGLGNEVKIGTSVATHIRQMGLQVSLPQSVRADIGSVPFEQCGGLCMWPRAAELPVLVQAATEQEIQFVAPQPSRIVVRPRLELRSESAAPGACSAYLMPTCAMVAMSRSRMKKQTGRACYEEGGKCSARSMTRTLDPVCRDIPYEH